MTDSTKHPVIFASSPPDGVQPPSRPPFETANRLTMFDRVKVLEWAAVHAAPVGVRLEIHSRQRDDASEIGDYIGLYRVEEPGLVWAVAHDRDVIVVWHGSSGEGIGTFNSMGDALAAVEFGFPREAPRPPPAPDGSASAEQRGDDPDLGLILELDALESAIMALAEKTRSVVDAAEKRGSRIDAMLANVDAAVAALAPARQSSC